MNEDFDKLEEDTSGLLNKAKYLFLVIVLSAAYFFYAVGVGVWEWIKGFFVPRK